MARFGNNEKQARENAQANANATGETWCVFSDTSGAWNSERYRGQPLTSWSGVTYTLVNPNDAHERCKCEICGIYPGDPKVCAGCEAYAEHTDVY